MEEEPLGTETGSKGKMLSEETLATVQKASRGLAGELEVIRDSSRETLSNPQALLQLLGSAPLRIRPLHWVERFLIDKLAGKVQSQLTKSRPSRAAAKVLN